MAIRLELLRDIPRLSPTLLRIGSILTFELLAFGHTSLFSQSARIFQFFSLQLAKLKHYSDQIFQLWSPAFLKYF